jgi:hypothetical protein
MQLAAARSRMIEVFVSGLLTDGVDKDRMDRRGQILTEQNPRVQQICM